MAAINNIFPLIQALRLSLEPFKSQLELNNSFRPGQVDDAPLAVYDFLAGLHLKEASISGNNNNRIWRLPNISIPTPAPRPQSPASDFPYLSPAVFNRSARNFQFGNVVSTTANEWIQFQAAVYGAYAMLEPINLLPFILDEWKQYLLDACGIVTISLPLVGYDGLDIVTPPLPPNPTVFDVAKLWNDYKVPYDKLISNVDTQFVFGIVDIPTAGPQYWLRGIGYINVDQQAAIDNWNYTVPSVMSR